MKEIKKIKGAFPCAAQRKFASTDFALQVFSDVGLYRARLKSISVLATTMVISHTLQSKDGLPKDFKLHLSP